MIHKLINLNCPGMGGAYPSKAPCIWQIGEGPSLSAVAFCNNFCTCLTTLEEKGLTHLYLPPKGASSNQGALLASKIAILWAKQTRDDGIENAIPPGPSSFLYENSEEDSSFRTWCAFWISL